MLCKLFYPVLLSVTFLPYSLKSVSSTRSFATLFVNLAKSAGTVDNFGISNLSTSVFKLARLVFDAKLLASTCVTFLKSVFVA